MRRRRHPPLEKTRPITFGADEYGNPSKSERCSFCQLLWKRFTISPPLRWNPKITWQYSSSTIQTIKVVLFCRKYYGPLQSIPRDLFLYLLGFVVRACDQHKVSDYREICDDCVYYHREINKKQYINK